MTVATAALVAAAVRMHAEMIGSLLEESVFVVIAFELIEKGTVEEVEAVAAGQEQARAVGLSQWT